MRIVWVLVFCAVFLLAANAFAVMPPQEFSQRMSNILLISSYYPQKCLDPETGEELPPETGESCQAGNPQTKVSELNQLYSQYYSLVSAKDLQNAKQKLDQIILGLDELQGIISQQVDLREMKSTLLREYSFFERDMKRAGYTANSTTYVPGEPIIVPGTPGPAANTAPQPEEATVPVPIVGQMPLSMVALFIISLVLVAIVGLFLLHLTKKG